MTASAHPCHDLFIGQLVATMSRCYPSGNPTEGPQAFRSDRVSLSARFPRWRAKGLLIAQRRIHPVCRHTCPGLGACSFSMLVNVAFDRGTQKNVVSTAQLDTSVANSLTS
jgi:hypothetical protein